MILVVLIYKLAVAATAIERSISSGWYIKVPANNERLNNKILEKGSIRR